MGVAAEAAVRLGLAGAVLVTTFASTAVAHEHGSDKIEEGETISKDPMDTTLWLHILLQTLVFGVLFPLGMVLGVRSTRPLLPSYLASKPLKCRAS